MFEIFDELMEELQENETMEQDNTFEDGNAEITPEEAEAVGRGEYSPEARTNAWNEYNRLSGKDRETFLRGHSRNAHIMNMELRNERAGSTTGEGEAAETTEEKESVGYSSDYYEHRMASALESGNRIAYNNARSNWAKAKVRESVGSTTGEGEEVKHDSAYYEQKLQEAMNGNGHPHVERTDWAKAKVRESMGTGEGEAAETTEEKESVGYSSDYYEHRMASALESGNRIAYNNARSNWAKAKVRESVGTGEGEAAETTEEKESVGYSSDYYKHQMASALESGNKIAYDNARSNWAKATVRESVGYKAEDGSIIEGLNPNERYGRGNR